MNGKSNPIVIKVSVWLTLDFVVVPRFSVTRPSRLDERAVQRRFFIPAWADRTNLNRKARRARRW